MGNFCIEQKIINLRGKYTNKSETGLLGKGRLQGELDRIWATVPIILDTRRQILNWLLQNYSCEQVLACTSIGNALAIIEKILHLPKTTRSGYE